MARRLLIVGSLAAFGLSAMLAREGASHFTKLDGNRIHYVSFGEGEEAVVFIHGWTCDATFWKAQAPVYEQRRSLLIDLPGHGLSDKPEIPYTMELFARAVDAVMTDAKVARATLVGHSMGTPVAVQFLRLHPAKVAGLIIVDGFVPQPPKDDAAREKQKAQRAAMALQFHSPDFPAFAARMLDSMFTKESDPAMREQITRTMLSAPLYVMTSAMEGMYAIPPVTESYPQLPVAAMMVKRSNGPSYREYLTQHFQLVDFREFDAGHFLMIEQGERFNAGLREFLDRKSNANR